MQRSYIIDSERISDELAELGETGTMSVLSDGGVYVKREENANELYIGKVEDIDAARQQIDEYFNQ